MPSVIWTLWFDIILRTRHTRRWHYAHPVLPVCVSNELNPFWLVVSLTIQSMEEWQANLLAAEMILVASLLRDCLTLTMP